MAPKSFGGGQVLALAIRSRRKELGLTIQEAANAASIGMKSWTRYEAGEAIREDKVAAVCRVLQWYNLPGMQFEKENGSSLKRIQAIDTWSDRLAERYGVFTAASFAVGSDMLLSNIEKELESLSKLPQSSHIGQLPFSLLKNDLPKQFLMHYDYEFLFLMRSSIISLCSRVNAEDEFEANSIFEQLLINMIIEKSSIFREDTMIAAYSSSEEWKKQIFEQMGSQGVLNFLYSDCYVTKEMPFHFCHWLDQ